MHIKVFVYGAIFCLIAISSGCQTEEAYKSLNERESSPELEIPKTPTTLEKFDLPDGTVKSFYGIIGHVNAQTGVLVILNDDEDPDEEVLVKFIVDTDIVDIHNPHVDTLEFKDLVVNDTVEADCIIKDGECVVDTIFLFGYREDPDY